MIPLRRLTGNGISRFAALLDEIRKQGDADIEGLLQDDAFSEQISDGPVLEVRPFQNRRDAAEYLDSVIGPLQNTIGNVEEDVGLWAWLAAAWIDELAPLRGGQRALGESARWIPTQEYRSYYRHLLAGPFRVYRAHRDNPDAAMALLATPVGKPGEVVEQCASRQQIVSNRSLVHAITHLYYDPATNHLKRGSGSKGPGSPRRLAFDILAQLDLTWDFYGMSPGEILRLLPAEFNRFKPDPLPA